MRRFLAGSMPIATACLAVWATSIAVNAAGTNDDIVDESVLAAGQEPEGGRAGQQEHEGHQGDRDYSQPPLTYEAPLFWWSLVLFVLFVVAARRVAWQPLIEGLDAREARINGALADAKKARAQAEELLRQYENRMADVDEQVREMVAKARREAESAKAEVVGAAHNEAAEARDRALADIASAREETLSQLSADVQKYAETTAGRLLGRPVTTAS